MGQIGKKIIMMNLISNQKTNWRYLLFVFALAIVVAALVVNYWSLEILEETTVKAISPGIKTVFQIEARISAEQAEEVINQALPSDFDRESAVYRIEDLNEDGKTEIIISASSLYQAEPTGLRKAIFIVVAATSKKNYQKIGELIEENIEYDPSINNFQDIDGDKQKEILIGTGAGGAYTIGEGVLKADFSGKKLDWVRLKEKDGTTREAIFFVGASVMHQSAYGFGDSNHNGKKEIFTVQLDLQNEPLDRPLEPNEKASTQPPENTITGVCRVSAYEWDGVFFSYNEETSKLILSELRDSCTVPEMN